MVLVCPSLLLCLWLRSLFQRDPTKETALDFDAIKEHIANLPKTEFDKFTAWKNAGQVKRRWFAFIAGVIAGIGATLLFGGLLGCSGQQPRASMNADGSACFPGPKVVE